jgi:hypothetical protein
MGNKKNIKKNDIAYENYVKGYNIISHHPMFSPLLYHVHVIRTEANLCPEKGWAVITRNGYLHVHPTRRGEPLEWAYVIAHCLLHLGLGHFQEKADNVKWNTACDCFIAKFLADMKLGHAPPEMQYKIDFSTPSEERLYNEFIEKGIPPSQTGFGTAGVNCGDIVMAESSTTWYGHKIDWRASGEGITLDEFYRRSLGQGLSYHEEQGRGYIPAGLVEEIRALSQPPVPWDVELAQWFDNYFSPLEKVRSYARPSRRQSSTPDIARPHFVAAAGSEDGRTYGVILDTSGSMDRSLLAKALGAIASYSISREVPYVRVVFCDAAVYDQGYMAPEAIADSVKVRGRGGTILQPGIDLLDKTEDFPKNGPLLINSKVPVRFFRNKDVKFLT